VRPSLKDVTSFIWTILLIVSADVSHTPYKFTRFEGGIAQEPSFLKNVVCALLNSIVLNEPSVVAVTMAELLCGKAEIWTGMFVILAS